MILYNTPLVMVLAFLGLTLLVGFYGSSNVSTFREYAVGNKKFSTPILIATTLATVFGGHMLLSYPDRVYNNGIWWMMYVMLGNAGFWISNLLWLRMRPFMQHLSLAETIGTVYGRWPRLMVALCGIGCSISAVSVQVYIIFVAINRYIHSVNPHVVTILATFILVLYATIGGMRAVTLTDVLQFITFSIIIALLAKFMFLKTGKSILENLAFLQTQKKFQFNDWFQFGNMKSDIQPHIRLFHFVGLVLSYQFAYATQCPNVQRIYMCAGPIQVKKVFKYSTFLSFFMVFIITLIGLFVFVANPGLSATEVWSYILANVPSYFKGCIAVCLLGMAMSTADSNLHLCSVIVSHDMMAVAGSLKKVPYIHQLRLAKLTTILAGLCAIMLIWCYGHLYMINIYVWCVDCSVSIVTAPFILAVLGFRGTSRTALIGMITGALSVCFCNKWVMLTGVNGLYMVANGLAMLAAHYLLPQPENTGWIGLDSGQKHLKKLIRTFKKYNKSIDL